MKKCATCGEELQQRAGIPGDVDICENCCSTDFIEVKDRKEKKEKKSK